MALAWPERARAADDPSLLWKKIETPHFRITFYSGEDEVAQHVAELAEAINTRLAPAVGWEPSQRTEIMLTDGTDSANGSATALPYNAIRLFITAPDDLSPLGDVDDWYQELVTHEYTHILHTDHIGGIPALVNAVLGKTLAPNQVQPRWLLEGLAVFEESARTSGGRLRSSAWNMFMRADVLEDNVATLDVFSNTPRRWPQGNIWYLYGSFFLRWVADTYGEQSIRKMIDDYGSELVPYGVNRSIRRATGRTFEELYVAWVDTMRRDFGAQAASIRGRGLREGTRLTHIGQNAQKPRWIPSNAWPGHAGELLYALDDGHDTGGLYRLPVTRDARGEVVGARENERELMIRTSGIPTASFEPSGAVVFNSVDIHNNLFAFNDLFELGAGKTSASGIEGLRTRWTDGFRATDPDVSPDGRRVVFVSNHRGTSYLQVADLTRSVPSAPSGIGNVRALVRSASFDQVFAPRWARDNRHVAYSSWTKGGYRDIRYVDAADGSFVEVTHDRAIDSGPSFSPDGRWLYFHSDRTGVTNVYAWEIATHRLMQVTNVLNGAYEPEPSPDGKTIAYLGYTSRGYDLYAITADETQWAVAAPYVDTRPAPPPPPPPLQITTKPYDPLDTMRPRRYAVQITPGNFGQASILSTAGGDISGHHSYAASITTEFERPEFQGNLQYVYGRLPFDVTASVYRSIGPRSDFQLGNNFHPTWIEEAVGASTGISYALPRAFDAQSFSLSYSVTRIAGELPFPADKLDPYETPSIPQRGMLASLHLGWQYSNAQRFLWSVGPEKGFTVGASVDVADPAIASQFTGYAASANFATYHRMPWGNHHSLALHVGGGTGGGNLGGNGLFYIGGFTDLPFVDTIRNTLIQGGIVLRGYPVVEQAGRNYALFNAEYRFPIVNIDRGPSTLPFFLNRISGALFADYGSAFDDASAAKFKTGVGGELWFDATFGYILGFTFRIGYAKGLSSDGINKTYFVATVPF